MKAIRSLLLIDGTGRPEIQNGVLCVDDDGLITDVGPVDQVSVPENAEEVDWSEYVVVPGFIDSHTHLGLWGAKRKSKQGLVEQRLQASPYALTLKACVNLLEDLESGTTTSRALGDSGNIEVELRDAINRCEMLGPRLLAGAQVRTTHGAGVTAPPADGEWEIRKTIREGILTGADVMKIFGTSPRYGLDELGYRRGDLSEMPTYTKQELVAGVDEAHGAGLRVAIHALGGKGLRWAIEAGGDSIEHANLMKEEDIELFLKYEAVLSDPNLQLFFSPETGFSTRATWDELPAWWREKVVATAERTRVVMTKALAAGVKFALGTDSNHGELWREAVLFKEVLGASSMQAIQAITKNTAETLGVDAHLGTLEKGKFADAVALGRNPLEDLTACGEVVRVMKRGVILEPPLMRSLAMMQKEDPWEYEPWYSYAPE